MKNEPLSVKKPLPAELPVVGFGDRLWIFWHRFAKQIYRTVAAVLLLLLGVGLAVGYGHYRQRHMQKQFLSALNSPQSLPDFSKKYAAEPLGAVACYRLGNGDNASSCFSLAAENYRLAARGLGAANLAPLAKIAESVALLGEGRGKEAEDLLKFSFQDGNTLAIFRAAAGYQLALLAYQRNDFHQTKLLLEAIRQLPFGGIWGEKAALLAMAIDESAL